MSAPPKFGGRTRNDLQPVPGEPGVYRDAAGEIYLADEPAPSNGTRSENHEQRHEHGATWLDGAPMDPLAESPEPLPSVPGFPYAHRGAGVVIVGPTGGGRSSLVQAGAYDAARAGLRVAYLGSEVTEGEFNARAADLVARRGDVLDDALRAELARVRWLNLASVIAHAWQQPGEWTRQAAERFDVVLIDPLSSVASTLGLDFDTSNAEFVLYYDRLVQPLAAAGVLVVQLENLGHAIEAKSRAKGASAKSDRADLTFACKLQTRPEAVLIITAQKVRSVRAPIQRGDSWTFDRETQRIVEHGRHAPDEGDAPIFRPTVLMERVSRAVEAEPGLSVRALRAAVSGKREARDLALDLLVAEGYVERRQDGQAFRHYTMRAFRADDEPEPPTVAPVAQPWPDRGPATVETDRGPRGPVPTHARATGHGSTATVSDGTVALDAERAERIAARHSDLDERELDK
ncbi:MAG: hypothetical protein ACR2LK_15760 [Solirubrobacteraceae bacterium]